MRGLIRTGVVDGTRYWMGYASFSSITQFNVNQLVIPGFGIGFVYGVNNTPRMFQHNGIAFTWGDSFPEWNSNTVYDVRVSADVGLCTGVINGVARTMVLSDFIPGSPVLMGSSQTPANLKFFDTMRFAFAFSRGG
jgi:hypothetical protein